MDEQNFGSSQQGVHAETPLTNDEMAVMLWGLVSYPTVYKSALQIGFDPALFSGTDDERAFFWFSSLYGQLFQKHEIVTQKMFMTHLSSVIKTGAYPITPDVQDRLTGPDGLVFAAFSGPPADVERSRAERHYVQTILRRFLNARVVNAKLKNILSVADENTSPAAISSILDTFRKKAQAIDFVGHEADNAAIMPLPGGEIILPPIATPTTISWIDNYIGGFRAGDVLGLLGPYSGGKTTMLSTIGVRMARQFGANNENKLAVYICYEDGAAKMNWSFYSAAAHIHRDRFKNKVNSAEFWAGLTTRDNLLPYERELACNRNGEVLLSETDRWLLAADWFNKHFAFLDFSASAATNYRGNGGILEIASTLESLCDRLQMDIGVILIDYLGPMLNRFLYQDTRTRNAEQIWRHVQSAPEQLKTQLAIPFNTAVVIAHQLAQGDIKHIPPFRYVSHADAQGSKAFAENVHACLCLNKPDPETHVSTINWSKIRFDRPACGPYGLVKIDPHVVDVWQADDEYYINDVSRKIMRKGEMSAVASPAAAAVSGRGGRRIMRPDDESNQPDIDAGFLS